MSRITNPNLQKDAISALQSTTSPASGQVEERSKFGRGEDDSISIQSRHTLHAFNPNPEDEEEDEDPWSVIPRPLPSTSTPESIPILTRAQRKQLILRALFQLFALFLICLVGLGGTLWLALPVIEPKDKPLFKIPRNFQDLQSLNSVLQHYKDSHFYRVLLCWIIVYIFLQAFSIPGSMYMSILAGALFGVPLALPLVCASVATGASICYLISKTLGVVLVALPSWQARVEEWKIKLDEHKDNMLSYLIVIRMMPLPPHNIVNILAPHLGISIPTFWLSTFFGIFAVSVIHTTIGEELDQMTSADDFNLFSLRNILVLLGVCVAVLIPVFVKRFSKVESLESAEDHGAVFLGDNEQGEQDAERLPDSFRQPSLLGFRRGFIEEDEESDDELPYRNLDTNHIISVTNTYNGQGEGEESFPTWSPNHDEEGGLAGGGGRGGVFSDRLTGGRDVVGNERGRMDKLIGWIVGRSGIKL